MENDVISIRDIQHYLYCKHRWGLLNIGSVWAENYYVTKANLLHDRVHNPDNTYTIRGKKVFTSVSVYNDQPEINIYGITDCIEATIDKEGIVLPFFDKRYKLCVVEYKPTQPKNKTYNEDDLMQVFAQKLCVDYMFKCDCEACLYYSDTKKRINLQFSNNYEYYKNKLLIVLMEMRSYMTANCIPEKEKGQKCSGCSLKNICMPSVVNKNMNFRKQIKDNFE